MSTLKHTISVFLLTFISLGSILGQADTLPKVFFLGEYEDSFQNLDQECGDILLTVCQDSMDLAYGNWLLFLGDIEEHAKEVNFDINGVKLWMKVFWNADGTMRNLAYYPKPNSRNMDFEELTAFFEDFSREYAFSLTHLKCFSHYSSASFPTFSQFYKRFQKQ